MNLFLDNWQGVTSHDTMVEGPSFDDVRSFLSKLNGANHTLMAIELDSGAAINIGGGPKSYMAQCINGDAVWLAHGSEARTKELSLVVGGQESLFQSAAELNHQQAFDVLSVFYHGDGALTTNVRWRPV